MIIELAYPSLLFGVSQQTPRERQNGQLTEQLNMLSDPVTGLRRRPGLITQKYLETPTNGVSWNTVWSTFMEVGELSVNLVVFTQSGQWIALDKGMNTVLSSGQHNYLKTNNATHIRATNNTGLGWILNTEQKPNPVQGQSNVIDKRRGFITIRSGAFLKDYSFKLDINQNGAFSSSTITYTTPSGSASGDAAKSTPEGIAKELFNKLNGLGKLDVWREGSTLFFQVRGATKDTDNIGVTNLSGANYAQCSANGTVRNISELPSTLPREGNGWIVGVGTTATAMQYYRWEYGTLSWNECASRSSIQRIDNMPVQVSPNGSGGIQIKSVEFEGRLAGDDDNNPYPTFIFNGITGIGTFMGRLVLMSGSRVCLSASRYPTRTMRSTVTEILDTDPFEVASGAISSASFEHAVQFNKDLILFASTHQAVIPTGNQALSPKNAMLVITSEEKVDTTSCPSVVGQTLMYASKPSAEYFGVGELTPSAYTASVYTPQTLTDHLPKFMKGACRHIVCNSASNIVAFSSSVESNKLYICEYFWNNQERSQISFHEWLLPGDIASLHFADDKICVTLDTQHDNRHVLACSLDPKHSQYLSDDTVTYLDCYQDVPVQATRTSVATIKTCQIPTTLQSDQNRAKLVLASLTPGLVSEPIGIKKIEGNTVYIDSSYKTENIRMGWKYESAVTPNAPVVFSTNQAGTRRMISDSKDTLQSAVITAQNSGNFNVSISDVNSTTDEYNRTGLTWSSRELDLGKNKISKIGDILVPCRLNAHTAQIRLSTDGNKEMNILSLVYNVRLHRNKNRRQY